MKVAELIPLLGLLPCLNAAPPPKHGFDFARITKIVSLSVFHPYYECDLTFY
jgi:hypothetical protein